MTKQNSKMKKLESPEEVAFMLQSITTDQFAILDERIIPTEDLELRTDLSFGIHAENHTIGVFPKFTFTQNSMPVMLIEIGCHFLLKPEHWDKMKNQDGNILVPKFVMRHMAIIAVGTARGVLHAKTEGSVLNEFVLPTINVTELIDEDIMILKG